MGHYYSGLQMQGRINNLNAIADGAEWVANANNPNPNWMYDIKTWTPLSNGGQSVYNAPNYLNRTTTPIYVQPRAVCRNYLGQSFYC